MPEDYTLLYVAAGILTLVILAVMTVRSRLGAKKRLLKKVREGYGRIPDRGYTQEELQKIRKYTDAVSGDAAFFVDDITWNDLSMDDIFIRMNHTFSSAGEEVLYALLRTPCYDTAELAERERLMTYFREHPDVRESLSLEYLKIGRTRKYAMVDFLDTLKGLALKPDWRYLLHTALLVLSLVTAFLWPSAGVMMLLVVLAVNIYNYYHLKSEIEPHYVSLAAMAYLVNGGLKIASVKHDGIETYQEALDVHAKPLKSITNLVLWLGTGSFSASQDFLQLILDFLRMITLADLFQFNRMVRKVRNQEAHLLALIQTMGYLEAMISVASYRETLAYYAVPEIQEGEPRLTMIDGYHPLVSGPVPNSFSTRNPVLVTGSNASGKSTFLKMTALNALLSETVHTVHASQYSGTFFRIYSSMALKDSLATNESYYMVEIRSIKRIMDDDSEDVPVLCFVDEVLRGTNTVERIAASAQILKHFRQKGVLCFAATHDVELTYMLELYYDNYHFEENFENGEISFSYRILDGRATTRTAIKLLSVMGYDPEVTEEAERTAEHFMREGSWPVL
ncbi:MAG: hypothetical protein J6U26_03445 [Lachnospiraceae bacterium]|nr:hypothetical protein [Lachnospiraceae bacterium]